MILLVRADDRLVHGMVAVSWTSELKPETILVANDDVAQDEFRSAAMRLAKPAGVKLVIKTKDNAIKALNNPINCNKRIFLITESVEDAHYIWKQVHGIQQLNIGTACINRKANENYYATLPQIFMTEREFYFAKEMNENNVEVFVQTIPSLDRLDFDKLEKIFNHYKEEK